MSFTLEQADERLAVDLAASLHPETWLAWVFPAFVRAQGVEEPAEAEALFADHHREFWAWVWSIEHGVRPLSFVGVWPRGGAKSTSAELAVCALGCTGRRKYGLYVCETQDQADDHVGNIGSMLESDGVEEFYPEMARRLVGKFGNSRGWRRNRLRTSTAFTVDAIGLDTASRGVKLEDQRPDFIVFDDIDHHDDSDKVVKRKIATLTKALLPAGSEDVAVLAIQNLVHRNGIFARLADGRADFLLRRRVSGPVRAVEGLVTKHVVEADGTGRDVIVGGTAAWAGQSLDTCQSNIDDWGLVAFLEEAQHEVNSRAGAMWVPNQLATVRIDEQPDLARVVVAVDPSGGDGPDNDAQGIIVAGRTTEQRLAVLADETCMLPPEGWARTAIDAWADWDADAIVAEINYGGAMVKSTVDLVAATMLRDGEISKLPRVVVVTASRGKRVRAEPVAALYGRPDEPATWSTARAHHVGHFPELEDEMTTTNFDNPTRSPNRIDALVWAATDLLDLEGNRKRRRRSSRAF